MNDDNSSTSPTLAPTSCPESPSEGLPSVNEHHQQVSSNKDVQAAFDQLTRKDSSSKPTASPPSSFTQRLIDRGVPVPSFPSWDRSRSINTQHSSGTDHDLSSSTGSFLNEFDSSNYYGLSPFVTSSFSANIPAINTAGMNTLHQGNGSNNDSSNGSGLGGSETCQTSTSKTPQGDARYFSLLHRYERENAPSYQNRRKYLRQQQNHSDLDEEDDEDNDDMEDEDEDNQHNSSPDTAKLFQRHGGRLQHIQHEDSDIELSDDDLEKHSPGLTPSSIYTSHHHLHHTVSSPLLWRTANGNRRKTEIGKLRSPSPLAPLPSLSNQDTLDADDDDNATAPPSSMDKFNKILAMKGYKGTPTDSTSPAIPPSDDQPYPHDTKTTTTTATTSLNDLDTGVQSTKTTISRMSPPAPSSPPPVANKLARGGPRSHILQTPVFEVVNANTIKDRYLFLFSDLLLICKPIMDENIIVGGNTVNNSTQGSQSDSRFRFRSNENSLFQVKNIVELSKLTLYLSQEDQQQRRQHHQQQSSSAPPRKMHPILASALRKFKSSAESGIAYLLDKQVLTLDPLSIANFLFKTPDLNRQRLGQYLGDRKHGDVYDAFLDCFRLVGLRLDEALRILLTTFRLPSQWEALEYVVERFAKKWHDANQNVVKFHEDMVVKVVVAMLFLNAEIWYDADSDKDVFWYARKQKENSDRQRLIRRATTIDQCRDNSTPQTSPPALSSASRASTIVDHRHQHHQRLNLHRRESVAIEPLHYITALRENSEKPYRPSLHDFLDRWTHYDQYALVPREFMEDMYRSILNERLETGLDRRTSTSSTGGDQDDIDNNDEDTGEIINVVPHRLPTRLIKGVASAPITLSIPRPDPGLQIKLRGQDLLIQPNILDFTNSNTQSFTITGSTLGRTSMMFIKSGVNAGNYVSPTLPRTKALMVERHFMRYTFQLAFSHADMRAVKAAAIKAARAKAAAAAAARISTDHHQNSTTTAGDEKTNNHGEYSQSVDSMAKSPTSSLMMPPMEPGPDESDEALSSSAVEQAGFGLATSRKSTMVKRRYMFSVETEQEKIAWVSQLAQLCGNVVLVGGDASSSSGKTIKNIHNKKKTVSLTAEERVALQVLKELLLADEVKKGTANVAMRTNATASTNSNNNDQDSSSALDTNGGGATDQPTRDSDTGGSASAATNTTTAATTGDDKDTDDMTTKSLKQQKKKEDGAGADSRSSLISLSGGATNVVTKRGHEIIKLVVQNSMVPFMLGFLRSQIE